MKDYITKGFNNFKIGKPTKVILVQLLGESL
jgi:hypothetical protein